MLNLKIYKKTGKKIAIISSAMVLGTSLIGCGNNKKESLLKNTILEQSRVITFKDGHKDIAVHDTRCCYGDEHFIYKSIITNEYFIDEACKQNYNGLKSLVKENITTDESIVSYLTSEELIKATNEELTKDDIINILVRIVTEEKEKTK